MSDTMTGVAAVVAVEVDAVWGRVWGVRERMRFGDWCEANVVIVPEENADYAGPYSRAMVVHVSRLFEEFFDEEGWDELSVTKGSQSTLSSHALMEMVRKSDYDPGNIVYATHNQKDAKDASDRFRNFLEGSELWVGLSESEELDEKDVQGTVVKLPGMKAWFIGGGSVGEMAGKPGVGLVVIDEHEKHKRHKREAKNKDLLRARGKATKKRKLLDFSSPTLEDGPTWEGVKEGSGHRYFVPCPECGHMQWLQMDGVVYEECKTPQGEWDLERVRREARYECAGCHEKIPETRKRWMLARGEWRATHYREVKGPDGKVELVPGWVPGRMSAYLSDLYALWEGSAWGDLAVEKIEAKRDKSKLQDFINGRLGEAWKEGAARKVGIDDVMAMRRPYRRGSTLEEPVLVMLLADTQDDCWKATKIGFTRRGDVMVSDWGMFLAWKEVVEFGHDGIAWDEESRKAMFALVDEGGHRTREVRRHCLGLAPIFNPSRGVGGANVSSTVAWKSYRVDPDDSFSEEVDVLTYNDDVFKRLLYRTLILDRKRAEDDDAVLMFPEDMDREFALELCREHLVRKAGRWQWEGESGNDFGDTVKMGLIGWSVCGHLVREEGKR